MPRTRSDQADSDGEVGEAFGGVAFGVVQVDVAQQPGDALVVVEPLVVRARVDLLAGPVGPVAWFTEDPAVRVLPL